MRERSERMNVALKRLVRLWCFLRGHDWVSVRADNGRSAFTRYECARCEAYRDMQFNYNL